MWYSFQGDDDIHGQLYEAGGTALGGEFTVNSFTTSRQIYPAVAANEQGRFVVAWQSDASDGADTDSYGIRARPYRRQAAVPRRSPGNRGRRNPPPVVFERT